MFCLLILSSEIIFAVFSNINFIIVLVFSVLNALWNNTHHHGYEEDLQFQINEDDLKKCLTFLKANMRAARGISHTHSARTLPARANQKNKSEGCVPLLRSGPLAALRLGRRKVSRRKEKERKERIMPSLMATTSALARTYNIIAHALH